MSHEILFFKEYSMDILVRDVSNASFMLFWYI